jgi:hypothetical protein
MSIVYGGPQGPLHDFQVSNALCAATRETNQYVAVHFLDGRQLKPQERPSTMIVVVAAAAWIMDGEIVVSPRHGREGLVEPTWREKRVRGQKRPTPRLFHVTSQNGFFFIVVEQNISEKREEEKKKKEKEKEEERKKREEKVKVEKQVLSINSKQEY